MAIPPTAFTVLLYEAKTSTEMYERLKTENCLSDVGLKNKKEVIELISRILKIWKEKDRSESYMCGSGPIDQIANALLHSDFITSKARRLHQPHLYKSDTGRRWWKFWT